MSQHYHQDVRTLSDEELQVLSTEIEHAYRHSGYEEEWWIDDEAEDRYYELNREMVRRQDERDPEAAARHKAMFGPMLRQMAEAALLGQKMFYEREADLKFIQGEQWDGKIPVRIGDTITIKKPSKFLHGGNS